MLDYDVKNRIIDWNLINVILKNNIDCNFVEVINNIENMKKIAKENKLIIDELEVDVDFGNWVIKNENGYIMRKKWRHKMSM